MSGKIEEQISALPIAFQENHRYMGRRLLFY